MTRSQIQWTVVLFFIVLSLFLFWNTPVKQLLRLVELPDELHLQEVTGTITSANIGQISYQGYQLNDVDVKFSSSCLLSLSLCYQVNSDDYQLQALTAFNLLDQSFSIRESQALIGNEVFEDLPQLIIKPKGEFLLSVNNISFQSQKIRKIDVNLNWLDAGIMGEPQTLGDYSMKIFTQEDALKMVLKDDQSLLSANGNIEIFSDGNYEVDINFESKQGLKPSIKNAITLFAKPAGLSKYRYLNKARLSNKNKRLLQFIDMS